MMREQFSWGVIFLEGNVPRGELSGGNFPWGQLSLRAFVQGQLTGGQLYRRQLSGRQLSGMQFSSGEIVLDPSQAQNLDNTHFQRD